MQQDVFEHEQGKIDAAYEIAEELLGQLRRASEGANQHSAHAARNERGERADRLQTLVHDASRLFVYGRVDFVLNELAEESWERTIYIGGARLSDAADDPHVVSWEAEISRAFFDAASFVGDQTVELKRSFVGADRTLASYSDERLVGGTIQTAGADPLLEAIAGRTSGELRQVVATIQAAQYELMERPLDKHLVVQGGPGTGKTIVGLHRVSVLLYRSRELNEADILVVGPSSVFMNYIARVLPELGRTSVTHSSINGLTDHGVTVRGTDTTSARRIKGAAAMAKIIERYLIERIRTPSEDLVLGPDARINQAELARYCQEARDSRQPYNVRRERLRVQLLEGLGGVVATKRPTGARNRGEQLANEYSDAFASALDRMMASRSSREVVYDLLTGPKILASCARSILTSAEQAEIRRTASGLADHPWSVDDLPLLDEAAALLDGASELGGPYQHVLVDEAQDLSPMQLRMLSRRTTGSMTILGDLAQATSPWSPSNWIEHLASGGIDVDAVDELTLSYRTSAPLLDFANQLLPAIDVAVAPTSAVIEDDEPPALMRYDDTDELTAQLVDVIESLQYSHEKDKVGVIAGEELLRQIAGALDDHDVAYTWAQRSLTQPVTLVPADQAKGLEFEHVIVLAPEALYRSDSTTGARLLYVALTRARTTLTLLYQGRLPGPLAMSSETLSIPSPVPTDAAATATAGGAADEPTILPQPRTGQEPHVSYCSSAQGLIRVEVADERASVELAPAEGGRPHTLAHGYAISGESGTAWALVDHNGRTVSLVTEDLTEASCRTIVEHLEG